MTPARVQVRGDSGARWEIEEPPVASGAHALMYRARGEDGLLAALKLARLPGRDGAWLEDEADELRLWGEHPTAGGSILPIWDVGTWEGRWFHVTTWSTPLLAHLAAAPLSLPERRTLARALVTAGLRAREAGLAHPNLHPGNIFVDAGPDEPSVFLSDMVERPRLAAGWSTTALASAPTSTAPEHALGLGPGDDVYALAVGVYTILVGRLPEAPMCNALQLLPRGRRWIAGQADAPALAEALELSRCRALTPADRAALARVAAPALVGALEACLAPDPTRRMREPERLLAALATSPPTEGDSGPRGARRTLYALVAGVGTVAVVLLAVATRPTPPPVAALPDYPMVVLAPGSFTMGSAGGDPTHAGDEGEHPVTLTRPFLLGAAEVTQGAWAAVTAENPVATGLRRWEQIVHGPCSPYDGHDLVAADAPVVCVSWLQVATFANDWSVRAGLAPAYRIAGGEVTWDPAANGYRLPTEAEWEYAARAGTDGLYGGPAQPADLCGVANARSVACEDGAAGLLPVRSLAPNAWGLYDMLGNAQEWVWDRYGPYPSAALDPTGPATGKTRVNRGGSWFRPPHTVAWRSGDPIDTRAPTVGVRLARNAP
ncbi:MAG: SUMF1/EgtB/PvdO family nonheme iron enzyme [Pseudomonadota bacterium]|nr:SUMF1/EgtB/PvdO family nonheme iron enzyme [Pseudomonadota bacterium]